jgi:hypothetical protein
VTRDHRLVGAERIDQSHHVSDQMEKGVSVDLFRPVRLAVAAHVRRDRVVSGLAQRPQLMTPRIPGFRKTVTQDDERAAAGFGEVDANAVRLDRPVCDFGH